MHQLLKFGNNKCTFSRAGDGDLIYTLLDIMSGNYSANIYDFFEKYKLPDKG